MAREPIITPIPDKHTPWENYAGQRVEEYIKEQLDLKAGYFIPDDDNKNYLVFADEENYNTWHAAPEDHPELLLASLPLPAAYVGNIELVETQLDNYIAFGSVGHVIKANLSILDAESRQPTGEMMDVTVSFRNGSSIQKVTRSASPTATFEMNVDEYLKEGNNIVTLAIVGKDSKAGTSVGITYHAIRLVLTDAFDISHVFDNTQPDSQLDIQFQLSGSGTKYLEFYIDDEQVEFDPSYDVVSQPSVSRNRPISLYDLGLSNGRHTLQYRAYIEVSAGVKFYSETLWRDFIVSNGYITSDVIVTAFSIPADKGVIANPASQPIPLYGVEQYTGKKITYAILSPRNISEIQVSFNGNSQSFKVERDVQYTYDLKPYVYGTKALVFTLGETTLSFSAVIAQSSFDLEEITNGLFFALSGQDRTNESSDRDDWSYGDYAATFSGFQWNRQSGWTADGLVIPGGASLSFNHGPMATDPKTNGGTFEFEFETRHVLDDDAVICDLRGTNGAGLLITASEASIVSAGNVRLATKFKAGETIRVAFVVNKTSGVRNLKLAFIYIDGILSGAVPFAETDSFASAVNLAFSGSANATLVIKYLRFYNRALSDDEILNNYILYRPTVNGLIEAYNRNDIQGSTSGQPDFDKLSAQIPIMVITGNMDKIQHFGRDDKKTYVMMERLEFYHPTDPTKNFTLVKLSVRAQGTSSMDYPRKNGRSYTQADSKDPLVAPYVTKMFDYQGNELIGDDRLYAFKDGSQPVSVHCWKADFAESSGTHNTGIARIWNDVLKNVRISNVSSKYYRNTQYPCRTMVQQAAIDNDYPYDVRTTVDGFPIALFYKPTADADLIFLGRYNLNNDKSNESVFGFRDIPGFDYDVVKDAAGNVTDCNVQCWEVVNGDFDINQFIDLTSWDAGKGNGGWQDNFESRYPDDSGESGEASRAELALKDVCTWINSTKGASKLEDGVLVVDDDELMEKFSEEKWDHLDVYKIAAYYIYLMRFGAVDQTVKNAMFTCEDCRSEHPHWFYINYDNDTINGLSNAGDLRFGYDIDRQTHDGGESSYAYAGHASVLWNNLEADEEFMGIVKEVDQALFEAGLSYTNVIKVFNEDQSAQWCERLHNYDYNYKYIGVWLDKIDDYDQLAKLQGARRTHRAWWLANRFAIYDGKNATGQYKQSSFNFKPQSGELGQNEYVTVTPAVDGQIFGYRVGTAGTEVVKNGTKNVALRFDITDDYYIGASHFFQNMVYAKAIDLSRVITHIEEVNLGGINSDIFESNLSEIIINSYGGSEAGVLTKVNGFDSAKYLEKFVMCNVTSAYMDNKSLDFSENEYLKELDLRGSTYLTSVTLPDAAPVTTLRLPSSLQSLVVRNLNLLATLALESDGENIAILKAYNTPLFSESPDVFLDWFEAKVTPDEDCEVYIDNITWDDGLTVQQLLDIAAIGDLTLKGQILVTDLTTVEQAEALMEAYGDNCFSSTNELWLRSMSSLSFLSGPDTVNEGESAKYTFACITPYSGRISYEVVTARAGVAIDPDTGILTTTLNDVADTTAIITGVYTFDDVSKSPETVSKTITIKKRTYPTAADVFINGDAAISSDVTYTASVVGDFTGATSHAWTLAGDITTYFEIQSESKSQCKLRRKNDTFVIAEGTLTYTLYKTIAGVTTQVCSVTKNIAAVSGNIAVTRAANAPIMDAFWNAYGTDGTVQAGVLSNENYITKAEARSFTGTMLNPTGGSNSSIFYPQRNNITHFEEFENFTGVIEIPASCFRECKSMTQFAVPSTCTSIGSYAFYQCNGLVNVALPESVTTLATYAFSSCAGLKTFRADGVTTVTGSYVLRSCPSLEEVYLSSVTNVSSFPFYEDNKLKKIYVPKLLANKDSFNNISTDESIETLEITVGIVTNSIVTSNVGMQSKVKVIISKYATTESWTANNENRHARWYEVDSESTSFWSSNGCVVRSSDNTLLLTPYASSLNIPEGVERFRGVQLWRDRNSAFYTNISIPSTITAAMLGDRAYQNIWYGYPLNATTVSVSPNNTELAADEFGNITDKAGTTQLVAFSTEIGSRITALSAHSYFQLNFSKITEDGALDLKNVNYVPANCFREITLLAVKINRSIIGEANGLAFLPTRIDAIILGSGVSSIANRVFSLGLTMTKRIDCYAMTAPTIGSVTFGEGSNSVGYTYRLDGTNELHVPVGATGYTSGYWATLMDADHGFTIYYDLSYV